MNRQFIDNSRRALMAGVVVTMLVILALIVLVLGRTPPRPSLPNPNGYDDFAKAGTVLTGKVGDYLTLDHDSLRDLVATNAEPLRLLRLGLSRTCVIPYDEAIKNFGAASLALGTTKSLAQLLAAEGRLRELDDRIGEAASVYAEAICFGNQTSRGGVIINRLVGIACEGIGLWSLVRLMPKLSCEDSRPVMVELEKIESNGVSWDEIRSNERAYARRELLKLGNPVECLKGLWEARIANARAEVVHKNAVARLRLLATELALRCYEADHGRAPANLAELVPKYTQRVASDPFSGRPMIYRPQGTNWLLYSVGQDGVDDGGRRVGGSVSASVTGGDLFYDSRY